MSAALRRRRPVTLVVALGLVAVIVTAVLSVALHDSDAVGGSARRDLGRPVHPDPRAEAGLKSTLSPWGHDCDSVPARPDRRFRARLDATGRIVCQVDRQGVVTVTGYQFTSEADLAADFSDLGTAFPFATGACAANNGRTTWTGRDGRARGQILCTADGDYYEIYWTDRAARRRYVVTANTSSAAQTWWARTIRPQGTFPTAEERALLKLIRAASFETSACKRAEQPSPLSQAEITCSGMQTQTGRRTGADWIQFATFANVTDLHERIDADQRAFTRGTRYDGGHQTFLGNEGPAYSLWRSSPDHAYRGRLLAFPASSNFWIAWTVDAKRLYARIGRSDERPGPSYDAFRQVGVIGLE